MKLLLPGGREIKFWERDSKRFEIDNWISNYLIPGMNQFTYGNTTYPLGLNQTMVGAARTKEISNSLPAFTAALKKSPPAYAAQMVRALVLSQLRFTFRYRTSSSTPRKVFGTQALAPLEQPWTNATTGEMIARMEWHAGLAGNAFVTNFEPGRLRVLRPDWTAIVYGSQREPEDPMGALDGEVIGYVYQNGGFSTSNKNQTYTLRPSEVAHWSPLPDPLSPGLGMSWITPALRDIQGDNMQIEHKIKFYENGATPNLVIKGVPGVTPTQFAEWIDKFKGDHDGLNNAYRTMYLATGMDATVVGANLQQLDFAQNGGYSETRISQLSRVPAALLGISAGLKGSSLNAGNYAETRRTFSDTWYYPTAQDLCAALSPLIEVPPYAELWFDVADVPLLREDAQIASDIQQVLASTINSLITGGFTPESAVSAVVGQNMTLLKHDPRFISVQLQSLTTATQPQTPESPQPGAGNGKPSAKPPAGNPAARSMDMGQMTMAMPPVNITLNESPDPAPVQNYYITVAPAAVTVEPPDVIVNVQPASAPDVTIQGDTINVAPADVTVPVTVNTPEVQVQGDTITVEPAAVTVPVTVNIPADEPDTITVNSPVTVNIPPDPEETSKGVTVERDKDGNVIGVTPK